MPTEVDIFNNAAIIELQRQRDDLANQLANFKGNYAVLAAKNNELLMKIAALEKESADGQKPDSKAHRKHNVRAAAQ